MNILITGGASGLGEAITTRFAKNKENIVYFTFSKSKEKAEAMNKLYPNTKGIKCDFTNLDEVNELSEKIKTFSLDVFINNAYSGEAIINHFNKIKTSEFIESFNQNLIPTLILSQSVINSFRKVKKGKIITILTSFLVNNPPTGASIYVANKAYLSSMVKSWASENAKYNITSNSISPAFMLSGFTSKVDERIIEQMIENHPLKRLLTFEEVADAVSFLSETTNQINGIDLLINSAINIK
jgi:3-oxoacyl-[acyl-carrier protein] reductase